MSDRLKEIDDEIMELQTRPIEDTECEVYSRIVGYYRSVRNWNIGKSAEYGDRVMFDRHVDLTGKNVHAAETCTEKPEKRTLPFGIAFNEELTATRIA